MCKTITIVNDTDKSTKRNGSRNNESGIVVTAYHVPTVNSGLWDDDHFDELTYRCKDTADSSKSLIRCIPDILVQSGCRATDEQTTSIGALRTACLICDARTKTHRWIETER